MVSQQLADIGREAKKDLVKYRSIIQENDEKTEVKSPKFHYDWSHTLLHGTEHEAYEAFRESGKSQICLRSYFGYCCTFPHRDRDYILLLKANSTLAESKLEEIENEYLDNPIASRNLVRINKKTKSIFDIDVLDENNQEINVRIEAYGKGGSIRGLSFQDRRPKVIVADDLQDVKDSRSETILENDWDWFVSDIIFLSKHGRIFLIGNNLGDNCIIERVLEYQKEGKLKKIKFNTHRIPIMYVDEHGKNVSSWKEAYPIETIEAEKEDYREMRKLDVWYRERMCESLADELREFKDHYFQRYTASTAIDIAKRCNIFIRTDLAGDGKGKVKKAKKPDFNVICVGGIDEDNNLFIFDCWFDRCEQHIFISKLFDMVRQWKPRNVGIEKVAYQASIEGNIKLSMSEEGVFFRIIEQKANDQKELRIRDFQPRVAGNKVWIPHQAWWLTEFLYQFIQFPKAKHDDIPDTVADFSQETFAPKGKDKKTRLNRANAVVPERVAM